MWRNENECENNDNENNKWNRKCNVIIMKIINETKEIIMKIK